MAGYTALLLASKNVCKIDRIITLGTKLNWSEEIASNELKMLDVKIIEDKLPDFAKELQIRHHPKDLRLLLHRTGEMMMKLAVNQYLIGETFLQIRVVTKLVIGDKDKVFSLNKNVDVYRKLNVASFTVLSSTPQPFEKVNVGRHVLEIQN